ncbi:MAG: tyrosine-type recombinase/integrase [Acidimicrobiales bacterium]
MQAAEYLAVQTEIDPHRSLKLYGPKMRTDAVINAWIDDLEAKGRSHTYLRDLRSWAKTFLGWCDGAHLSSLTTRDAVKFIEFCRGRGLSQNTINKHQRRMKQFSRWAFISEFTQTDFAAAVETEPTESASEDRCRLVTREMVEKACEVFDTMGFGPDDLEAVKGFTWTLWGTGMRPSELWNVREGDILVPDGPGQVPQLRVKGTKVRRERWVPVRSTRIMNAIGAVARYNGDNVRRGLLREFLVYNGYLCIAVTKSGVPKFTPGTFRHAAITRWLNIDGCLLTDVSRWVGHKNPRTTAGYLWERTRARVLPKD